MMLQLFKILPKNLNANLSMLDGGKIYNTYYSPVGFSPEYSQLTKVLI